MPRKRIIGKGKLTEVQKDILVSLYLEEEGKEKFPDRITTQTWNSLELKNFIFTDEQDLPALTAWGRNVAKMILGVL